MPGPLADFLAAQAWIAFIVFARVGAAFAGSVQEENQRPCARGVGAVSRWQVQQVTVADLA